MCTEAIIENIDLKKAEAKKAILEKFPQDCYHWSCFRI